MGISYTLEITFKNDFEEGYIEVAIDVYAKAQNFDVTGTVTDKKKANLPRLKEQVCMPSVQ